MKTCATTTLSAALLALLGLAGCRTVPERPETPAQSEPAQASALEQSPTAASMADTAMELGRGNTPTVIHRPPGNEPTIAAGRKETSSVKPQGGSYASWLTLSERPASLTECLATHQLDKTPEFKRTVTPEYPPNLVDQETQGRVLIVFKVSASCQFEHWLAKPGSNAQLAQSSVKAMRQWSYGPALHQGKPVAACHQQNFSYRIE